MYRRVEAIKATGSEERMGTCERCAIAAVQEEQSSVLLQNSAIKELR